MSEWYPEKVSECSRCRGYGYTVQPMARVGLPGEYARKLCMSCYGNGRTVWTHKGVRIWPSYWVKDAVDETFDTLADAMAWIDDERPAPADPEEPDEDDLISERFTGERK